MHESIPYLVFTAIFNLILAMFMFRSGRITFAAICLLVIFICMLTIMIVGAVNG